MQRDGHRRTERETQPARIAERWIDDRNIAGARLGSSHAGEHIDTS